MTKYKGISMALVLALTLTAAGCSGGSGESETQAQTESKAPATEETAAETESETEAETVAEALPEGQMYSFLSGEPIDRTIGMQRPVAVMINNIEEATPQQCGTSQADVLYEAIVEGGITRLMAVFQDTSKIEKVGSVRSARHNYIDFANNFDAIYCHYGRSYYAMERIAQDGIQTVSEYVSSAYFQDNNYPAPHHIFASGETLEAGIAEIGVERNLPDDYQGCFVFNTEDTEPDYGTIANTVAIPYTFSKPSLEYDSETKLYNKFQYGAPHTDANTGEQLTFKNVIIQYANYQTIADSVEGCQDITLDGEGDALYITDGKAVNVTWKRADKNDQTRYYTEDGQQLSMNPGKTYIAVVPLDFNITLSE
ncbi:MAG TPA: DUF3048 domain-containing protein [Candidatus Scybalocola faecavium]|nr:DUF3048 domain-containing protein [Candidatus Scybalocola faecavium]